MQSSLTAFGTLGWVRLVRYGRSFFHCGAEEVPAVAAAEQEDEPLQIGAQFAQAVGGVADELCQGGAQAGGVAGQRRSRSPG
jgi:hypothetical protein